jgi:hypothetical protein
MRMATPLTWAVALLVAGAGLLSAAGPTSKDRPHPDPGAEAGFRALDRNGDGLLDRDEMPDALRADLDRWDTNQDGFIDLNEFKAYAQARPRQPAADGAAAGGPRRWDYRLATRQQLLELGKNDVAAGLNQVGAEGWELVAVRPGAGRPEGRGDVSTEYYFKRPASRAAAPAEPASGAGEFRVFRLKRASAGAALRVLDELLNGAGGGPRRARIVADPATNQLLVRARPADLDSIEAVLTWIDVPEATAPAGGGEGDIKVFRLKNASAAAVAKVLNEVMNDGGRRVRVTPEPVTNQLIVRARRDDLFTIEKLLQQLDVPADTQPPRKK